jgi:hypothetical protein
MSLDLELVEPVRYCSRCGNPLKEPGEAEVFSCNITHNLGAMAAEAEIYHHLWRPEEIGVRNAGDLIEPLKAAITAMKADPARFERHNASNGWGTYEQFVPWLEKLLEACAKWPEASVRASR